MQLKDDAMLIARLIKTVGGKLVGRIRLQKTMYLKLRTSQTSPAP